MPFRPRTAAVLAVLVLAPAVPGCLSGPEPVDVLATFYPTRFLAEGIAGDLLSVGVLVPPGHEPHDWEPAPSDVARLGDARLVVAQSRAFEPWLGPLVQNLGPGAPRVIYTAAALDSDDDPDDPDEKGTDGGEEGDDDAEHDHAGDPHTWLDPVLYRQQLDAALAGFVAVFPEHEGDLTVRAARVADRIDAVHAEYTARLSGCRTDTFVTLHAAFGLLAHRYGLDMHSVMGLDPEGEASPSTIDQVIRTVRDHNLTIVFTEPGAATGVMQTIADETGATVRSLDPIETGNGGDWATRMRSNLEALKEALGCPP